MSAAALGAYAIAIAFCVLGYLATNVGAAIWASLAFALAVFFAVLGVGSEDRR